MPDIVANDITYPLRITTMLPLDSKSHFEALDDMRNLGVSGAFAMTYYDGMPAYCVENNNLYRWREMVFGLNGLLDNHFAYPPGTVVNGKDYSGKLFNFVLDSGGSGGGSDMFFLEPSVNIEILDNPANIVEAMHFGNMDIGGGPTDIALVKDSFVSQSGYDIKNQKRVGDQIKMFAITGNIYLGHFRITKDSHMGYRILEVIEKGNWSIQQVYNIQKIAIHILQESEYTMLLEGSVVKLKRGESIVGSADLTALISGGGGATIVSGVLNPVTGFVTFTMSDSSTFDVDFSALLVADDHLSKEGTLAVKGRDVYENIFSVKAGMGWMVSGYYAADISTNYNDISIQGFPFPASSSVVVLKYYGSNIMLVKKSLVDGARALNAPGHVLSLAFSRYKTGTKSMQHLAHFHVLSGKMDIPTLNSNWYAYKVWDDSTAVIPGSASDGYMNENEITQMADMPDAMMMFTVAFKESVPLKKSIALPYTLKEEDNGRILHVSGNGNIFIPKDLSYGFECGFRKISAATSSINFIPNTGVVLNHPAIKDTKMAMQYGTCYLEANVEYDPKAIHSYPWVGNAYILSGDLENL